KMETRCSEKGIQGFADTQFAVAFADGGTSCWIDSPVKPESKYQSMLLELIDQLANNHKMGQRPDQRAVTGWSLGGYGALLLAARHPELVGSASSIIGLVDLPRTSPSGACSLQLFGPAESAPAELSIARQAAGLRGTPIRLFCSVEGIDVPHHETLKAALDKAEVQYQLVSCPGVRDMGTALQMWPKVLAYHAEVFRKASTQHKLQ
ncbi:MAG: alpha/beta hydrolase-fold protein, partial [Planctomycetota bacterium]